MIAILMVFTNCAGWSTAAMERFTRGGASSANKVVEVKIIKIKIYLKFFNFSL